MFFFLLQTEQGDIFKVTLESEEDVVGVASRIGVESLLLCCFLLQVTEIRIKYFDTVPVATSMCVLRTGFLFCACEFGNQLVPLPLSLLSLLSPLSPPQLPLPDSSSRRR